MGWIAEGWRGEKELWKVFWIYGALLIILAKVANVVIWLYSDINFDRPTALQYLTMLALQISYSIWFLVATWRCAFNTIHRFWGYVARVVVILFILLFVLTYYQIRVVLNPFNLIDNAIYYSRLLAYRHL